MSRPVPGAEERRLHDARAGVPWRAEWAWASIFLDVDLDGYEDLLVANGFERDYLNMDAHRQVKEMQARGGPRMPLTEIQR